MFMSALSGEHATTLCWAKEVAQRLMGQVPEPLHQRSPVDRARCRRGSVEGDYRRPLPTATRPLTFAPVRLS